ncbi:MAG: sulfite exporter TauE/SafE family protein [Acidobacteria bacterium]|nr:sulfite exporter TauE/SafE family protein [Acidobacteriota bacterium]
MTSLQYGLLMVLGFFVGILNVMAGGGSFLTLPAMIFMGMPPALANGTNRIALLAQNVTSVSQFHRRGFSDFHLSLTLGLCTLPGAVVGAFAAVRFDPLWFKRILGILMIMMLPVLFKGRNMAPHPRIRRHGKLLAHIGAFVLGFYGGLIQAGTGPLLIILLFTTLGIDLVRVNMHKVFIIGFYTVPALAVFILSGQVDWLAGLLLGAGNATGAIIGTRMAISGGERLIRIFVAAAMVIMAVKLLVMY